MSDLAAFYHTIKMASIEAVQNMAPEIPMIVAFDEVSYCVEPERTWSWGGRLWQPRFTYVPHNLFSYQKRPYNPPKIRVEPKYKPHFSLYKRCNSGSGWW